MNYLQTYPYLISKQLFTFLILISFLLFSSLSRATYIDPNGSAEAVVGFDSAPFDGQVFLVPDNNPYYTFTAIGWGLSDVDWVMGSESDELLYGWEPGDYDLIIYGWGINIDGIGTKHFDSTLIGGGDGEQRENDFYSVFGISESATVGVGTHFVQIEFTTYLTTSEIVATDVITNTFYVETIYIPEPKSLILLGIGLIGIYIVRKVMH